MPLTGTHLSAWRSFVLIFPSRAAYALLNYDHPARERLAWQDVDERLQALMSKAAFATRGRYYIAPQLLLKLRDGHHYSESHATLARQSLWRRFWTRGISSSPPTATAH